MIKALFLRATRKNCGSRDRAPYYQSPIAYPVLS